jgi:Zn-dependent protease
MPASLLACPSCGALVHAAELKSLAAKAELAEREERASDALGAWRGVLALLPANAAQYQAVQEKIKAISARTLAATAQTAGAPGAQLPAAAAPPAKKRGPWAWLAALGALAAKFKWGLFFLLGKGKLLLMGLLQMKTLATMLLTLGVYSSAWGWQFALGFVVSIYIHEMGHVASLRHYGIPASAPMFVPGLGAFVRMGQYPASPAEDARVGLAGPIWGAGAAVAAVALGFFLHSETLLAIGGAGATINLFNLTPVWQLDGSRGFSALSQNQRRVVAAVLLGLALCQVHILFWVVAGVAGFRAFSKGKAPERGDTPVLAMYLALAAGFALLIAVVNARGIR